MISYFFAFNAVMYKFGNSLRPSSQYEKVRDVVENCLRDVKERASMEEVVRMLEGKAGVERDVESII